MEHISDLLINKEFLDFISELSNYKFTLICVGLIILGLGLYTISCIFRYKVIRNRYKQENKLLKKEIERLKKENQSLKRGELIC